MKHNNGISAGRIRGILSVILFSVAVAAVADDTPVFRLHDLDYASSDLAMPVQQALYELEVQHQRQMQAFLERAAIAMYFEEEAKRTGRSKQEIAAKELALSEPTAEQVKSFYEANKERISHPLKEVESQIARMLRNQQADANMADLLKRLEKSGAYRLLLPAPAAPYAELSIQGFPSMGNPDATVTVVEFADYQCPHCKTAHDALQKLIARDGERVKLVFKDLPINRSGISREVAEGGVCAGEQGKFWPYHDLAFKNQSSLSQDSAKKFADELGLDTAAFQACMESDLPKQRIAESEAEASEIGIHSTPALFVNGRRLQLFDLEKDLDKSVKKALEETAPGALRAGDSG